MNCSRHWVFALDKSGSMYGPKWEKLKIAVQIISSYLGSIGFQFISVIQFSSIAFPPLVEHINPD